MICKTCECYFPCKTRINGKKISLSGRTQCLSCKPYKGPANNIVFIPKPIVIVPDGQRLCTQCNSIKPVSEFYNRSKRANKLCSWCKSCYSLQSSRKQLEFKTNCVKYKGGKCIKCGYNKCISALEFHHRDPKEKDFGIASQRKLILTELILKELDKCDLLCSNCHREEHNYLNLIPLSP